MGWHKVSDKLPPVDVIVMLSYKYGTRDRGYTCGILENDMNGNGQFWTYNGYKIEYLDVKKSNKFDYWAEIPPVIE